MLLFKYCIVLIILLFWFGRVWSSKGIKIIFWCIYSNITYYIINIWVGILFIIFDFEIIFLFFLIISIYVLYLYSNINKFVYGYLVKVKQVYLYLNVLNLLLVLRFLKFNSISGLKVFVDGITSVFLISGLYKEFNQLRLNSKEEKLKNLIFLYEQ